MVNFQRLFKKLFREPSRERLDVDGNHPLALNTGVLQYHALTTTF